MTVVRLASDYEKQSKGDFAIHMKDIYIPRVFMCDQCDSRCGYRSNFKEHLAEHEMVRYPCYQCDCVAT